MFSAVFLRSNKNAFYQSYLPALFLTLSIVLMSSNSSAEIKAMNTASETQASSPTNAEKEQIKADIELMISAMLTGDVAIFVEKTHPALFPLLGGKENFTAFTVEALKQLDSLGVKMLSNDFQDPGPFYEAGKERISIVPRVSVMEVNGQQFRTIGFMVAIKDTRNNTWKYLDGSGLREDRDMLWQMFPELDPNVIFPENKVEVIE
ncbi:hypothetical protein [Glaciecola sp. MF2-115]|uniref:hypothetical protein n=1 Tax=Glaciecola sp. MF2-115 TaxID=3384827 RepID=UPI0039A28BC6